MVTGEQQRRVDNVTRSHTHAMRCRSTRNAGTAVRFLSNDKTPAVDHRPAKATDMRAPGGRQGQRAESAPNTRPLDDFRYLYCPVTGLIMPRDPPASASMACEACNRLTGAPRNRDLCYQERDADGGS